jgi:hypothetical protein
VLGVLTVQDLNYGASERAVVIDSCLQAFGYDFAKNRPEIALWAVFRVLSTFLMTHFMRVRLPDFLLSKL